MPVDSLKLVLRGLGGEYSSLSKSEVAEELVSLFAFGDASIREQVIQWLSLYPPMKNKVKPNWAKFLMKDE
jgi:hypothetical protein